MKKKLSWSYTNKLGWGPKSFISFISLLGPLPHNMLPLVGICPSFLQLKYLFYVLPGNHLASGPGLDLCPCVHCSWCGHHATVPKETIWRTADPGVHVCPVSDPLHLHQDIGGYDSKVASLPWALCWADQWQREIRETKGRGKNEGMERNESMCGWNVE